MAAPSGPPVFSNQELVRELEDLLPAHWDEQRVEAKLHACITGTSPPADLPYLVVEMKYLARSRLAEVHALRVENGLLRGENGSLTARLDALAKLVHEGVPDATTRLEYERSSYRVTRFRDAVAALYEPKTHRLDAPPLGTGAVRPLVCEYVATKAEIVAAMQSGRLDTAVDRMRHLKHTEWTLRLGDVESIAAPRNEPMVCTRSKLPGIVTPEVNSEMYVWTPTPSSAESVGDAA